MSYAFDSNIKDVAYSYIRLLNINVTESSLHKEIEEHVFYPSLFSLSDTFDKFHVENAAYNISAQDAAHMREPFIALIDIPDAGRDFVLITDVSEKDIRYIYRGKRPKRMPLQQFASRFEGTVFLAERNELSGEPDFQIKHKSEKYVRASKAIFKGAVAFIVLSIATVNLKSEDLLDYSSLFAIKISGLVCTIFLLAYELNKTSWIVRKVCSRYGRRGCSGVLDSKAAHILGLSWSEIGFFYFGSTTLILLNYGLIFPFKVGLLSLLNSLTLPYIIYSIYYQWIRLKLWCPLCVGILFTLFMEFIWAAIYFWLPVHSLKIVVSAGISSYLECAALFAIPIAVWLFIKPNLRKAKERDEFVAKYYRLLKNPTLFGSILRKRDKLPDDWQALGINIGNPEATCTVVKVCNPFCGPCAEAHLKLEGLIRQKENVNLKIIFLVNGAHEDLGVLVAKHLLAIADVRTNSVLIEALDDWYLGPKKDYTEFAAKYPIEAPLHQQDAKILAMNNWCKNANISYTPTIIIDGYMVPEEYSIDDLLQIL